MPLALLCIAVTLLTAQADAQAAERRGLVQISIHVTGSFRGNVSVSGEKHDGEYDRRFSYSLPIRVIPAAASGIRQVDSRDLAAKAQPAVDMQAMTGITRADVNSIQAISDACGEDEDCLMEKMMTLAQAMDGRVKVDPSQVPQVAVPNLERFLMLSASDGISPARCGPAHLRFADHFSGTFIDSVKGVVPYDYHERFERRYPPADAELQAAGMCGFSGAIDSETRRYHLSIPVSHIRAVTERTDLEQKIERKLAGYADDKAIFLDLPLPEDTRVLSGERRVAAIADGMDALFRWTITLE